MQDYYENASKATAAAFYARLPDYTDYAFTWSEFHLNNRGDLDELDAMASELINRDIWHEAYNAHREITQNAIDSHISKAFAYAMHRVVDACVRTVMMTLKYWYIPAFEPKLRD